VLCTNSKFKLICNKSKLGIASEKASNIISGENSGLTNRLKAKAKKDPNYRPHTLKRYVKTRWTSFQDTVEWILEQAAALEEYFKNENDTVREGYFSSSNITMLKLFLCLSKKLQKYILIFENYDLDIVRVSKTLKECTVALREYLFRSKV